ncbi:MAG: glucose-6-phosphate isomerase [Candidatus Omnitrophota bacterium]
MPDIKFDFNNMMSFAVGRDHGVTDADLRRVAKVARRCHQHLSKVLEVPANRVRLGLEWAVLPYQDKTTIREIQKLGDDLAGKYKNVLSLGIGGSYLGLKAAQEALCSPYFNEFDALRGDRPKIYFEGNNLDPTPLVALLGVLDPKKTAVVVISKSGETTETKAAFEVVEDWLKKGVGKTYGRQIVAITDPKSGSLRRRVEEEQQKDPLSFQSLLLLPGVGGRYSELNMGLLHLAICGISLEAVLAGARAMAGRCRVSSLEQNPAMLYAVLHYLAYTKKNKSIALMMPFTELLKSTADWYCQLLAESLGKKYERKIKKMAGGAEEWLSNKSRVVGVGRTPVACRGTTDLHSIQQNNIEGENNKTVTMLRIERFAEDVRIPCDRSFLFAKTMGELLRLAQEATEWALTKDQRPSCTIILPELTPAAWGGLIYFFEMATAFEGELLNVNAFDQPGVEGYKNYMYVKLRKPGVSAAIAREIKKNPLKKKSRYIL